MAPAAGSNTVHHQAAKAVVKQEGTRPSCAGIDQEKQFCVQLLETYSGKEGHLAAIAVICQEHAYKGHRRELVFVCSNIWKVSTLQGPYVTAIAS